MDVPVSEVISKCIELGLMVSINQRLDVETITLIADEFGFEVELQKEYTSEALGRCRKTLRKPKISFPCGYHYGPC